jgi:hypothetical protein
VKQSKEQRQAERFRERQRAQQRERKEAQDTTQQLAQGSYPITTDLENGFDVLKKALESMNGDVVRASERMAEAWKLEHPATVALKRLRDLLDEGCDPSSALWQAGSNPWQGVMNESAMEPMLQLLTGEAHKEGEEYTDWRKYASHRSAEECLPLIDRALEASKGLVWGPGNQWQMVEQLGLGPLSFQMNSGRVSIEGIEQEEARCRAEAKQRRIREREQQRRELTRDLDEAEARSELFERIRAGLLARDFKLTSVTIGGVDVSKYIKSPLILSDRPIISIDPADKEVQP